MRLLLIGGAQRSGTTLLQTVLANSLGSPNLPEAHILCDILTSYKKAKEVGNKTRAIYPNDGDLLAFFRSFAERHVADITVGSQLPALVLKDPNFIHTFEEASAVFPQCARIVCMRDPRDIVASFVQIGQRETAAKPGKYKARDIYAICRKVSSSYQPLLPAPPFGVALVRYETLVGDMRGSLETLSRDTGLKLSLDRIEGGEWLDAKARHKPTWITELEGGPPSTASVGSFKRVLTGEEIAIVQQRCGPILEQFGYPTVARRELCGPGLRGALRRFRLAGRLQKDNS
jgi:protein-tyrosine sulfotransferase